MKLKGATSGKKLRGPTIAECSFDIATEVEETVVSGSGSGAATIGDCIYDTFTSTSIDTGAHLNITGVTGPGFSNTFTSLDTGIATVNSGGHVSRVSDGTARILIRNGWTTKRKDVAVFRTASTTTSQWTSFVTGSLAKQIRDDFLSRCQSPKTKAVFTTQDHSTPSYVRNTNNFAYNTDLSCISPWNNELGSKKAGCLITKKHFLGVHHYPISVGGTIRFVATDNTVVDRTVVSYPYRSSDSFGDLYIGQLDSDVPSNIGVAKIMPSTFEKKFGVTHITSGFGTDISILSATHVPVVATNQYEDLNVYMLNSTYYAGGQYVLSTATADSAFSSYTASIISGDSGSPCGAIINNTFIVLGAWTSAGGVYDISKYKTAIETAISPYTLTVADLSSFTDYS